MCLIIFIYPWWMMISACHWYQPNQALKWNISIGLKWTFLLIRQDDETLIVGTVNSVVFLFMPGELIALYVCTCHWAVRIRAGIITCYSTSAETWCSLQLGGEKRIIVVASSISQNEFHQNNGNMQKFNIVHCEYTLSCILYKYFISTSYSYGWIWKQS